MNGVVQEHTAKKTSLLEQLLLEGIYTAGKTLNEFEKKNSRRRRSLRSVNSTQAVTVRETDKQTNRLFPCDDSHH